MHRVDLKATEERIAMKNKELQVPKIGKARGERGKIEERR